MTSGPALCAFDCEVLPDYFLAAFRRLDTGASCTIEMYDGKPLDRALLRRAMHAYRLLSFSGNSYDVPVVSYALTEGVTTTELKRLSDRIVLGNMRPWEAEREFGFELLRELDHIDLIELPKGQHSLKYYAGRLHCQSLYDMLVDPDQPVGEMREWIRRYCLNDLDLTELLADNLAPQIALREKMSDAYGIDVRSKSDAQIAEAVLRLRIEQITGDRVRRPDFASVQRRFAYRPPAYMRFQTAEMRDVLETIRDVDFEVAPSGKVLLPPEITSRKIALGSSVYQMGIGGLHSTEKSAAHFADDDHILVDRDVASYYPNIIVTQGLYPKHLGPVFLDVYRAIVTERLAAKRAGDKVTADTLKIVLNGTFGKLGSMWSMLYSPDLLIAVTIGGQLSLLMLIEALELAGISVVSGNTDGVVIRCPKALTGQLAHIVACWERATGFETEETPYRAIYSRDVNNYIAIKPDGKAKSKGEYAPSSIEKTPEVDICAEAVIAYLTKGVPLAATIGACTDIRKFIRMQKVAGGAMWQGQYIGKVVRWYYSRLSDDPIIYRKMNAHGTHNRVGLSEMAQPCIELPDALPPDLYTERYIEIAREILMDIGAVERPPKVRKTRAKVPA